MRQWQTRYRQLEGVLRRNTRDSGEVAVGVQSDVLEGEIDGSEMSDVEEERMATKCEEQEDLPVESTSNRKPMPVKRISIGTLVTMEAERIPESPEISSPSEGESSDREEEFS